MNTTDLLLKVEHIAESAHRGQYRKFGGEPYIEHPQRVGLAADSAVLVDTGDPGRAIVARMVGLLHDVLEDTDVAAADLLTRGVPLEVVDAVVILTRGDETYGQYIDRVILNGNATALAVKRADLKDNLRDLPLGNSLRSRYEAALRRIEGTR
jgi:(p)ppGpp synthase/HD superfamily hydrolase